jgi:nitroreductase
MIKGKVATDNGDYWYMFDGRLATQNMMLAAYSLELSSVPVGLFDAPQAREILGVPRDIMVVLLLALGYPDEQQKAPRRREPTEIASQEKYEGR